MSESSRTLAGMVERILLNLDEGVFGAFYRLVIGFATIPAMQLVLGPDVSQWAVVPFLLFVLLVLRFGLAVVRKLVSYPAAVKETWSVRRRTAKLYDSYQWRKVFWIGAGLFLYIAMSGHYQPVQIGLSLFCISAGAVGMAIWRKIATDSKYPKPLPVWVRRAA